MLQRRYRLAALVGDMSWRARISGPASFCGGRQAAPNGWVVCGVHRLTFQVGPEPLGSFRMIERHYFKNKLMRSYDFTFGFVIP
jgi:hypothetical protein